MLTIEKNVLPMTHSDFTGKHCDLTMTIRGDFVGKNHGKIWKCQSTPGRPISSCENPRPHPVTNCQILPSGKLTKNYGKIDHV